jgi:hypothetical protein
MNATPPSLSIKTKISGTKDVAGVAFGLKTGANEEF